MAKKRLGAMVGVLALAVLAASMIALAGGPPGDAQYAGSKKCKSCHLKEHKTWSATKHAKAFDALQGDEQKNAECVKCHTTGFGKPGGFESTDKTPDMENVGCESCHGPGSAHAEAAKGDFGGGDKKINKVPQNTCVHCHNTHVNEKERAEMKRKGG